MATVDIGDEVYSTFGDVFEADTYLGGDVMRAASWAALTGDAKPRGLVSATRMLLTLPWCDAPPGYDDAPEVVKEVSFMLAHDLVLKPKLFADATGDSNIKAVKAGSASVEFFSPVAGGPPIPKALWNQLLASGLVCLGGTSSLDGPFVSGISDGCRPLGGRYPWDWPVAAGDYD